VHPEPNKMILKVFFFGMLVGPIAAFIQLTLMWACGPKVDWPLILAALSQKNSLFLINILLFAPLVEEFLKYAVVRWQVLKNPAFDEPLDAMLYLIISALGFAAIENIIYIFVIPNLSVQMAFSQTIVRFLSATLLHTLSSGILGYFLAKSFLDLKNRQSIFFFGFILAVAFHSFYNYLAWLLSSKPFAAPILATFLVLTALLVSKFFGKLKQRLSVCKI
jgi:RsiW-degrading membrane proteinase PrsW (M82 family)